MFLADKFAFFAYYVTTRSETALSVGLLKKLGYYKVTTRLLQIDFSTNFYKIMSIILRKYQQNAVDSIRNGIRKGYKKFILSSPTGSGKTIMFSYIVKNAVEKGSRCLILSNRMELLSQSGGALKKFGLDPIEIKAGVKLKSLNGILYVGMAQTLKRRVKKTMYQEFIKNLDIIIIDEAHYQDFNLIMPYISENTIVIGATATPHRESNQKSLDEFYQKIVEVTTISELIELGFLARPDSYGVDVDLSSIKMKGRDYDAKSMGDKYDEIQLFHGVYENYMRLTPGKKAIIFAPNISSSMTLVKEFKEKGLPIHHIDGETPKKERREILDWFDKTPDAMLSNVGILNAGFDQPDIEVVILYRATKSLPLFLQMVGRGSRVTETKDTFTILDFGNNIKRHGFWEEDREWSLKRKKKKKEGLAPVKDCPSCFAILPAQVMTCEHCGHEFERTEKEEEEKIIAELQLLTGKQAQARAKTASFEELELIAKAKNYKKGWVFHQLRTREQLEAYAKTKGYHRNWVNYQLEMRENQNAEL